MTSESRPLHPGMGQAVAERTILRRLDPKDPTRIVPYDEIEEGAAYRWEEWPEVAERVAAGNALLADTELEQAKEYGILKDAIAKGKTLMSGRHLQHGDPGQRERNLEVFTNCATAASTFSLFYLLLNGAGVGRCYDDDMMLVNWDNAPTVICVLDSNHPDFDYSAHMSVRDAKHLYGQGTDVYWFRVPDSREGWAQALEVWENAAFQKIHAHKLLILDFSDVRAMGMPIKGMQNRPSSGPVPLMNAFAKAARLKGAGLHKWRQAMYMDHYFAECVLVGGARRAARMSAKFWKDPTILEFIKVKRPIEYQGKSMDNVISYREGMAIQPEPFLWSSNDSVLVDQEFWHLVGLSPEVGNEYWGDDATWARKVYQAVLECAYGDGTGEPGLINVDKLNATPDSFKKLDRKAWIGGTKYTPLEETAIYMDRLAKRAQEKQYFMIVNPCGEIPLSLLGGYCTIADVVPYHCENMKEVEVTLRAVTRALIRVNLMNSLYQEEVRRTNRIGIGLTGVHEFAWKFFKMDFKTLINEDASIDFWQTLKGLAAAVRDEAEKYSAYLGVPMPETLFTVKPAGTTSKLFGLTEGWHLPSRRFYVRWVQFRNDDPLVGQYSKAGYPTRVLKTYRGHTIVGFPTQPVLSEIMPSDRIVTAAEATPEEQFRWLMLGEKYWINGAGEQYGGQISYTLHYDTKKVSFGEFREIMSKYMPKIRCCAVMPVSDKAAYEYQPEESVNKAEFERVAAAIKKVLTEDVDKTHIGCDGACPVDFSAEAK